MDDFDAFRRKLADAVTIAINSGRVVSARDRFYCCPLGCLPETHGARPHPMDAGPRTGIASRDLGAFADAFDLGVGPESNPYTLLGLQYRKRFP